MADPNQDGAVAPKAASEPAPAPSSAPAVDVDAVVQQKLAEQQAQFQAQLKEATGHESVQSLKDAQLQEQGRLQELVDERTKSADLYKSRFEQSQIKSALLSAASTAIDPDVVGDLLVGRCQCDEHGAVTIDGKPVTEAVTQLLKDKPYLAKAEGGSGSGAPQQSGGRQTIPRSEFDRMTPEARSKFIHDGGAVV